MTILQEREVPFCKSCGVEPAAKQGISKLGYQKYRSVCHWCHKNKRPHLLYRSYKKESCEECGFLAVNRCQLDVDHKDGNHSNHDPDNLVTLCANCHRLKTYLKKENTNLRCRSV